MKTFKKYKEVVEKSRTTAVLCDFCQKDMQKQLLRDLNQEIIAAYDWEGCGYGPEAEARVEIRLSNSYPEAGSAREYVLDVCAACFKTEILDRAKTNTMTESDW